jgi:hypothetical protein
MRLTIHPYADGGRTGDIRLYCVHGFVTPAVKAGRIRAKLHHKVQMFSKRTHTLRYTRAHTCTHTHTRADTITRLVNMKLTNIMFSGHCSVCRPMCVCNSMPFARVNTACYDDGPTHAHGTVVTPCAWACAGVCTRIRNHDISCYYNYNLPE